MLTETGLMPRGLAGWSGCPGAAGGWHGPVHGLAVLGKCKFLQPIANEPLERSPLKSSSWEHWLMKWFILFQRLQTLYGLTEITCWACRLFINVSTQWPV